MVAESCAGSYPARVDEMIPAAQVEQMIAKAVAEAVTKAVAQAHLQLRETIEEARHRIAYLTGLLYGTKAETSKVVFTHEHQKWIDPAWGAVSDVTPAPASAQPADQQQQLQE